LINVTDANLYSTTYEYDSLNRLLRATGAACGCTRQSYSYDSVGNILTETDGSGNTTSYTYDPLNRLVKITDALGNTVNFTYDAMGNQVTLVDENGGITTYEYDPLNRLISETNALGYSQNTSYDAVGNILAEINENSHSTTYEYDPLNRLIKITNPIGNIWDYSYDEVGNLIKKIDANGNTTLYTYDSLHRLKSKSYSDGTGVNYEYDSVGNIIRLQQLGGLNGTTHYEYDKLNRVLSVEVEYGPYNKTVDYSYDNIGNIKTMTYPDGRVLTYTYDSLNRLVTIADSHVGNTEYEYDSVDRTVKMDSPNGFSTTYEYDSLGRLLHLETDDTVGSMFWNYSYSYDNIGNILTIHESFTSKTTTYAYDQLNQLTNVTYPSGEKVDYTYDGVGNRITEKDLLGTTIYTYDNANRLLSQGTTTYSYDSVGNRISKTSGGLTTFYEYNGANQLTKATPPGSTINYQYSPGGNILTKKASPGEGRTYSNVKCEWNPRSKGDPPCKKCYNKIQKVEKPIEHTDDSGVPIATSTFGPRYDPVSVTTTSGSYVYLTNHQGSVTNILDMLGWEQAYYEYDAFGSITYVWGAFPENSFQFMGMEYEAEAGLYVDGGRFYDPETGTYLTPDMDSLSQGENAYTFQNNNPVDRPPIEQSYQKPVAPSKWSPDRVPSGSTCCGPRSEYAHVECDLETGKPVIVGGEKGDPCKNQGKGKDGGKGGKKGDGKNGSGKGSAGKGDDKGEESQDDWEKCGVMEVICEHEKSHQKDMEKLCQKLKGQKEQAEAQERARVRSLGLGPGTLKKALEGATKVGEAAAQSGWNNWLRYCRDWTECNAYKDTVKRLSDLATKRNCCCDMIGQNHGSPNGGEDDECCKIICARLRIAKGKLKEHCGKKAPAGNWCKDALGV
jgi:RHS repeat-associated protein